ncbi:MAG: nucleotide exchange factor GrpE [Planctomycetes bacterium]|nr:nucleotide exchange factor GrpE [Planctomycetota bacterium]
MSGDEKETNRDETAAQQPAAETGAADDAGQEMAALRKTLEEQEQQTEQLRRALADMDNRRKRIERQMEQADRYAMQGIMLDVLPVIDNFERALSAAEETRDFDGLHDGLKLVHDQLINVLRKHHVTRIDALGQPFDPNHHEAVGQMDSADHPDKTVIDVHEEGYQLHDRVIRPSRVIVSRLSEPKAGEKDEPAGDDQPCGDQDDGDVATN